MNRTYLELPYTNKQLNTIKTESKYFPIILIGILIILNQFRR